MSAGLTATAIIRAKDETGAAFEAVEARVKAVSKMVREVGRDIARVGKVSGGASEASGAFKGMGTSVEALASGIARAEKGMKSISAAVKAVSEQLPGLRQSAGAAREAAQGIRALREELDRLAVASGKLNALREGMAGLGALRRDAREATQALAVLDREKAAGRTGSADHAATAERATATAAAYREQGAALAALRVEVEAMVGPLRTLSRAEGRLKSQAEAAATALRAHAAAGHEVSAVAGAIVPPRVERRPTAAAGAAEGHSDGKAGAHGGNKHNSLHNLAEVASLYGTIEASEVAHAVVERYQEFDKERRYGKVIMGLSDKEQEPLVQQAIHESGDSKFNDIQFLETQRELAARGYNKNQVLGFTPTVAKLGQSFDVSMPEAVRALEGSMLAFHKDVSTEEKAHAVATRTADIQVKASKISGMDFSDIVQLYKYGAAPSKMAGLSEEMLLALGGMAKKNNMRGDESGVMVRALAKGLLSPTLGAQVAMQGAGINYSQYQKMPEKLDADGYAAQIAKRYGVALSEETKNGVRKLFADKALIGNAEKFLPAMNNFLKGADVDPKMVKTLVAFTRDYRNKSSTGVDTDGLLKAEIEAISKNPALANAIYGAQQGGRIYAALGDPETLNHLLDLLEHHADGMNDNVAEQRMAGFDGALSRLKNSLANVETALGRAFDGAGSGGLMTDATNALARLAQRFAEADPVVQRAVAGLSALGAAAAALKTFGLISNGFGIAPAAAHLEGSAVQLTAAARALQVAAGEQDIAGAVPGAAGRGAKGASRYAVHIGEEAVGAAAGTKVAGAAEKGIFAGGAARAAASAEAGAVEGGAARAAAGALGRTALTAEAVEIAATGVTLSAGTIMLGALAAATVIDAIKNSMEPKHQAASEPGFGRPFAPVAGFDINDPRFKAPEDRTPEEKEQLKPWWDRNAGAHPRGTVQSQKDTDLPGHWVKGPRGRMIWAIEDRSGPKHPAFFSTAPLGMDGLPTLPMPTGLPADPMDPRTWAHISPRLPAPVHEDTLPLTVPLPPERPAAAMLPPIVPAVAPPAAAPRPPLAPPTPSTPVPVHVVSTAANIPEAPLGPGLHRDFTLGNGTGGFGNPGMGAGPGFQPFPRHHAPDVPTIEAHAAPLGDLAGALSNIHATVEGPITAQVTGSAEVAVTVKVEAGSSLISAAATASQARASMPLSSGGTGLQRTAASPGTGLQRTDAAPGRGGIGHQ